MMRSSKGQRGAGEARLQRAPTRAPRQQTQHGHTARNTRTTTNIQQHPHAPYRPTAETDYASVQTKTGTLNRNNSPSANQQKIHKSSFMRFVHSTTSCGCAQPTAHTHSSHPTHSPATIWTYASPPSLSLNPSHGVEARGGGVEQWGKATLALHYPPKSSSLGKGQPTNISTHIRGLTPPGTYSTRHSYIPTHTNDTSQQRSRPQLTTRIAHSHWHRLDLTLHPTRHKFKRHTDERVRTPVKLLRTKVQIHTTPLHINTTPPLITLHP